MGEIYRHTISVDQYTETPAPQIRQIEKSKKIRKWKIEKNGNIMLRKDEETWTLLLTPASFASWSTGLLRSLIGDAEMIKLVQV